MSGLGWITESTILPSKPHQIEEVGQASLVDLKAALYASEERAKAIQRDPAARATEEQRRRELRAADPLGAKNRGVSERDEADSRADAEEAERREEALRRKAAVYEQMARGEAVGERAEAACLVDFELKQLTGQEASAASDRRNAWESAARGEQMS